MFKKLPKEDQDKIKKGIMKLKINPSKDGVIAFSKSIAPMILKETKKELQPKLTKVFKDAGTQLRKVGIFDASNFPQRNFRAPRDFARAGF